MSIERTFSIVKPDAIKRQLFGQIEATIESKGLKIIAGKFLQLSQEQAEGFYAEHEGREFYAPLVEYMTSGPVFVQILEGENAITAYRELMGTTNPETAAEGTIRKLFAVSMRENSVHGSDSQESATREIEYFFQPSEICA
ncbi:nucleoside-diphosphate kinase [Marinicellulosiphila megalodicopiae]|uniref:nucleoside-diphosphate kinase n=1 Tax=Marinicellulosiphila megalodicopiae TaxID=2724896 RepID=UPI003BB0A195